jgi:hypothetical protein
MGPGSTQYLLSASTERVRTAFREQFPDAQFKKEYALHSWSAGTTLHIVLAGLSAGAGIVAVEALKEAGKSLWNALSKILVKADGSPKEGVGDDRFKVTVNVGELSVSPEISKLGPGQEEQLKAFLEVLPGLYEIGNSVSQNKGVPGDKHFRLPEQHNELEYRWHNDKLWLIRSRKRYEPDTDDSVILGGKPEPM